MNLLMTISPIAPADRASIAALVQQYLAAQGHAAAEIDDRVARLYGCMEGDRGCAGSVVPH